MFYYACLNEEYYCTTVCTLSGQVNRPNMIALNEISEEYLGKQYDAETGKWSEQSYLDNGDDVSSEFTVEEKLNKIMKHLGI